MKFIGITGGIGAGKSAVLSYLSNHFVCRVELADLVAHKVMEPGQNCYIKIRKLLGDGILDDTGCIDRSKMSQIIFRDAIKLEQVNNIIHPAVKGYILEEVEKERQEEKIDYFFLEAALLIENGYAAIVDELWYLFTREELRITRLKAQRGYEEAKIKMIMDNQLSENEFRNHCQFILDNNGILEDTYKQIDRRLLESSDDKQS